MSGKGERIDLASLRARLAGLNGKAWWRSLEEAAGSDAFREYVEREFPEHASEWSDPVSRRRFLTLMGASLALAGVTTACTRQPKEVIVPFVQAPEEYVPGRPLFYATAMPLAGYGAGILVENHMGRPTKVEGNPDHPASLGATDLFAQASVLTLYDPDRSQTVTHLGEIRPWSEFLGAIRVMLEAQAPAQGAGIRILTGTVTSPTLAWQMRQFLAAYPNARWHQYEPSGGDNAREGARLAFGAHVATQHRFDRAGIVLSLDADFLGTGPGSLRHVRDFTRRRRVEEAGSPSSMSRLYVVETTPSITGAKADHRLPLRSAEIGAFARAVAAAIGVEPPGTPPAATLPVEQARWVSAVAADLLAHRGAGVVIAGESQPPAVHALVHAMNHALGNAGSTIIHTDSVEAEPLNQTESLRALAADMDAGRVNALIVLGGNPAYNSPADLRFAERLEKVGLRIHLGLYADETADLCHWHVPEAHFLEAWGDVRAFDGTASIIQPLIEPLYGGRTAHEVMAALTGAPGRPSYEIVRDHWRSVRGEADFEAAWKRALHDGFVAGSALPARAVAPRPDLVRDLEAAGVEGRGRSSDAAGGAGAGPDGTHEIVFRADPTVFDGSFANNGWLQECPKPLTKITWDNAALVSPATAERLGLENEDVVEVSHEGRSVLAPVWILPGQAAGAVTIHLGYGRRRAGRAGTGAGFNACALRTSSAPWTATGAALRKTSGRYPLACTQQHHAMEGRELVRTASLEHYREHPDFAQHAGAHEPAPSESLYPPVAYTGHAWGMAVDLGACIGCNACVVGCQAENNIPVVGKTEVIRGREMHWIRVDRYFEGDLDNPATLHQPVMCQHCENAPCEPVCPVGATVHSSEGLNDMVYNRCVGTRYCSNNCPYKVRRFNFFLYADLKTPSLKMLRNPDVTVRTRGVMEKCTYCVQRINQARIDARGEERPIRDGEIVTACQQACPAEAIVFGDINDPGSRVSKARARNLNYGILTDLGTRPRTTYLAALRNPNPALAEG